MTCFGVGDEKYTTVLKAWDAKRARLTLPPIHELIQTLDAPLADNEKIPIPEELSKRLLDVKEHCQRSDVDMLFHVDDECISTTAMLVFYNAVMCPPPSLNGTEDSFHVFLDKNIREVLKLLLDDATDIRNSNFNTATARARPSFALILNNYCVFRGEEKAPTSTEDAKKELSDKLLWVYENAPYVMGQFSYFFL
jgi:hypothetical protein